MLFACILINIIAIALPSLRISPLLLIRIATIALLYAAALSFNVVYIQSIGSVIGIFSELFDNFLSVRYCAIEEIFPSLLLLSSLLPIKPHQLKKVEREEMKLTENLKQILVGLILGDLCIEKLTVNARLKFRQGIVHKDYLYHLYGLFGQYCSNAPKITNLGPDKRTGKVYNNLWFNTYSLPCFVEFYNPFYPDGKKMIPLNIGDLLTPLSLCYWISDDGSFCKTKSIVTLCTESFSLEEVNLLVNTLNNKWDLKCYTNKTNNGGFRILIPRKSLPVLQSLLKDIIPSMMKHKIGL